MLLESTEENSGPTHFFAIISLTFKQKCCYQHFYEKRGEGYFLTDYLNKWQMVTLKSFLVCFNNKIVVKALLASLTAFLWFS